MKTQILKPTEENILLAKEKILNSQVVAIPTETVYGLAANAFDDAAVKNIFTIKGRPMDNPLIVHICDENMLNEIVKDFSPTAKKLAEVFWPGPLTMVLPKSDKVSDSITCGLSTVAVRMPSDLAALKLIRTCAVPIAAPSANLSGKPSPTSASHVMADLNGKIEIILDGGECEVGLESTVVNVLEDEVEILRPGKIAIDDFLKVVSKVKLDDGVFSKQSEDKKVKSPGMKYTHYSPEANVIMVKATLSEFCKYVSKNADEKTGVLVFENEKSLFNIPCFTYGNEFSPDEQATRLFSALREIDENSLGTIFARVPKKDGVGLAVYNRLLRACGFEIITLNDVVVVGLTGQTGSGKTTLCTEFEKKGAAVINCDLVAREVITLPDVIEKLVDNFGEEILDGEQINRKALAKLVFTNEENMIFLNHLMYPPIVKHINKRIKSLKAQGYKYIVLDAPTLFESGANMLCDVIVSVVSDEALRLDRIMIRDNMTKEAALERIKAQKTSDFYTSRADYVIENDKGIDKFLEQTAVVVDKIIQ